jgi:hypothetical protein
MGSRSRRLSNSAPQTAFSDFMQVRQELLFVGLYQFDRRRPMIKINNAVFPG